MYIIYNCDIIILCIYLEHLLWDVVYFKELKCVCYFILVPHIITRMLIRSFDGFSEKLQVGSQDHERRTFCWSKRLTGRALYNANNTKNVQLDHSVHFTWRDWVQRSEFATSFSRCLNCVQLSFAAARLPRATRSSVPRVVDGRECYATTFSRLTLLMALNVTSSQQATC